MIVQYQALNKTGNLIAESIEVEDIAQVYSELGRRGLTPVRIGQAKTASATGLGVWRRFLKKMNRSAQVDPQRASKKDLPFFTTQLAIMLETGTPLVESLAAIEKQMSNPHWRQLVSHLHISVKEGGTLASALSRYSNVFDSIYVSMVTAGEKSGQMSEILNQLATFSRQADRIRNKIKSAMIYPLLLIVIALGAMSALTFFVLPRFETVFAEMKVDLPGTTKTMLALSAFFRHHTGLALGLIIVMITSLVYWLKSPCGVRFVSRNTLRMPIIGPLAKSLTNARILRLIGLLSHANVPLLESLELTRSASKNYLYVETMNRIHDNVLNGLPMYEVMAQGDLFPASITQMVRTGEENSQVAKVMTMLADFMDDRNETQVSTLTSVMEPVILSFMGIIVGIIAISLVLPMFDLSKIGS